MKQSKLISTLFLFVAATAFSLPTVPTLNIKLSDLTAFHEGTYRSKIEDYSLTAEDEAKIAAEVKKEKTAAEAAAKEKTLKAAALNAQIRKEFLAKRTKLVDTFKDDLVSKLGYPKDAYVVHAGPQQVSELKNGEIARLQIGIYKSEADFKNANTKTVDFALVTVTYVYQIDKDEDGNETKGVKPDISVSIAAKQTLK